MRQAFQVDMDLCPPTKSETRPLSRSSHELVMWVGMLELNYVGEWQPVPVSRSTAQSAFLIHQGLQQRVVVNIGHSNDDGLSISEISAVRVGRCQLVDVHDHPVSQPAATVAAATRQKTTSPALPHGGDASEDMNLHILSSQCDTSDTNHLHKWHVRAIAFFDTSSHQDSPLLTQPSPHGHYVRLQLEVAAVADDCHSPITLATTIHLKVYSRNASIPRHLATGEGTAW
ncbi:hypothetical protein EV182_007432 [Spiromyces aspiralis]|uniref:Uncharacterized protein n=1 Tax=Spiromyces aspiralis TaxID=68401 RepID=A0ACC1H8D1_9FUNG|nr:hypothetical protein EV182_007432 [Spiromyces aspiralis]